MKHVRSLFDLNADDVQAILAKASELKTQFQKGERPQVLPGRVLAMVFEKPSLRTRNSFEAAMAHLGGKGIFIASKDAGLNGREALPDIARVLGSYSDAIALRTFSQKLIEDFSKHAGCPVINALSDDFHPCQALTDLFTIQEVFGTLDDIELVYLGDGNNVARSLAIASGLSGLKLTVVSPPGYELQAEFLKSLKTSFPQANVDLAKDVETAVKNADIIYTDVWASMGQEAEANKRRKIFADFQVNAALMAKAPKDCRFMHDLPAHRGEEVTDDVLDGPQCIAFLQAENRMHLAKGLLFWLMSE